MKIRTYLCLFSGLCLCILVLSCAAKIIKNEHTSGDISSIHKILIAAQSSDFKNALIDKLIIELENSGYYINLINVQNLGDISSEDYSAIILVTTKMIFSINATADEFIRNSDERNKIILFFTEAGGSRISGKYDDIDAMSSASRTENIDDIIRYIMEQVKKRL